MAQKIYLGDIGTIITVETGADLTGATTMEFLIKKPSGAGDTWTAVIPGGSVAQDGILIYTTILGDLDESGQYALQAHRIGPGVEHLGNTAYFDVEEPFDE